MTDNVIPMRGLVTSVDIPTSDILEDAIDSSLDTVVIMGYSRDGAEYFTSSTADGGTILWLMERLRKKLLE